MRKPILLLKLSWSLRHSRMSDMSVQAQIKSSCINPLFNIVLEIISYLIKAIISWHSFGVGFNPTDKATISSTLQQLTVPQS